MPYVVNTSYHFRLIVNVRLRVKANSQQPTVISFPGWLPRPGFTNTPVPGGSGSGGNGLARPLSRARRSGRREGGFENAASNTRYLSPPRDRPLRPTGFESHEHETTASFKKGSSRGRPAIRERLVVRGRRSGVEINFTPALISHR